VRAENEKEVAAARERGEDTRLVAAAARER
jgi:hypothetical protein